VTQVYQDSTGPAAAGDAVLDVRDLSVLFPSETGTVEAVRGVSYRLRRGEVLGIVGESGSGKSVSAMAVLGLLPESAKVDGSIRLDGRELLGLDDDAMSKIRGRQMAMVFQDPLSPRSTRSAPRSSRRCRSTPRSRRKRPGPARSSCSTWSASRTRSAGWTPSRTSSPAACASAR
jgi:ABC-type oligopeptide transport system ATPase subunit